MVLVRSTLLLGALAVVGCSSSGDDVKLGVDVQAQTVASSSQTRSLTTTTGTTAVGVPLSAIKLSRVRILVDEAKLQGTANTGVKCDPNAHHESGPFIVDLTGDDIAKGAHRDFSIGSVPAGTYGEAEIEIKPLDPNDKDAGDSSGAEFADFRATGASLLIDGTYQGKAFQFAGHFKAEQGKEGPITIDGTTSVSVPFAVNPNGWFADANGNALDPTDATQHSAIAVAICKTLDTEVESTTAPAGGGGGKGGRGGPGPRAHCVE